MTEETTKSTDSCSFESIMELVGAASNHFELDRIRFMECNFSYIEKPDNFNKKLKVSMNDQVISHEEGGLRISMLFEFSAPSPFEQERQHQVAIATKFFVHYNAKDSLENVNTEQQVAFARVNGIYNAWPYLREYVRSCLVRLDLPPFELPLLRANTAVELAGYPVSLDDSIPSDSAHEGTEKKRF